MPPFDVPDGAGDAADGASDAADGASDAADGASDRPDVAACSFPALTLCAGAGCVDLQTSVSNCGACSVACAPFANASVACQMARCTHACAAGFGDCDGAPANGCEVALSNSVGHCGACGHACVAPLHSTATCAAGACGIVCDGGYTACGVCVDTATDLAHCGACSHGCVTGQTCAGGVCTAVCASPFTIAAALAWTFRRA